MTESNCDKMLTKIREIEALWREDMKKPCGGGLDSKLNQQLASLRGKYNQVCTNHEEQTKIDG